MSVDVLPPRPYDAEPSRKKPRMSEEQAANEASAPAPADENFAATETAVSAADTAVLSAAVASGALTPAPDPGLRQVAMAPIAQFALAALGSRSIETKLLLPNARVGVVIGKGGAMINHIRETSKATLDVSESSAASAERVVTFAGDFGAVYTAFSMVLQHLAAQPMGLDPLGATSLIEATLLVPRNKTGGLIGRSGASINRVRSESGATVKVGAPEDIVASDPDVRKCVVSGTLDQVMQAFTMIVHKLEETPAGAARGPDPSVMGMYATLPQQAPPMAANSQPIQPPLAPGTMPVQFQVPNESMGAVIGRAGSTINQIRQMSGAKVEIAQSVPGMAMRLVTVTGTPDQIQMAQYLIQVKMGGGPLPTSSYLTASNTPSNQHDYLAAQQQHQQAMQQQHLQQQLAENYGQYNQQDYQQLQQMQQMHQQGGAYHAYPGF